MPRVKGSAASQRRRRKYIKAAKGQFGHRKSRSIQARRSVVKGLTYAFRDRKVNKRASRTLWIIRINAACKENDIAYSRFIKGLIDAKVDINRKMIAELAVSAPSAFKKLVKIAKDGMVEESEHAPKESATKSEKPAKTSSAKK